MTHWIVDTGPLVAFFDKDDAAHIWVKEMWMKAPVPMLTCDAVLAEAAYLLNEHAGLAPAQLLLLLERKIVSSSFNLEANVTSVIRLLETYSDQGMQLADACIVRISELHRNCRVFTLNHTDFSVYRRFERQVIPLITPA